MPKYPWLPRSVYAKCWDWNSRDCKNSLLCAEDWDHERVGPVKQSRYSWLPGGYMVVIYFQYLWNQKIWYFSQIWPCRSMSIATQNNSDLNQGVLRLWSKFQDSSFWKGYELWCRQAKNWVKFEFWSWSSKVDWVTRAALNTEILSAT